MSNTNNNINLKSIIDTLLVLIGIIPFLGGLYCSAVEAKGLFSTLGIATLGFSASMVLLGIIGELRKDHGSLVISFIGIFVSLIGGLFLLVNYLIK